MEDTIQASSGQAQVGVTEPVAAIEEAAAPFNKEDLKAMLHEIVLDIHSKSPNHETAQKLLQEFSVAKADFIALCERVEEAVKKLSNPVA